MKATATAVLGMMIALTTSPVHPVNVYYIGNSLTDNIVYDGVAAMAKNASVSFSWGRHMIPGAPLDWLWDHRTEGINEPSDPTVALTQTTYHAITMQIGQRFVASDVQSAANFINLTLPKSPQVQAYIFMPWPNKSWGDYSTFWNKPYTGTWDNTWATIDYIDSLVKVLRVKFPAIKPVRVVYVGAVLYELDQQMKKGTIPGYTTVQSFYADDCHLNSIGEYVAGCTMYATVCNKDPRGATVPSQYGTIGTALAKSIQDAVYKVLVEQKDFTGYTAATNVRNHPMGVSISRPERCNTLSTVSVHGRILNPALRSRAAGPVLQYHADLHKPVSFIINGVDR